MSKQVILFMYLLWLVTGSETEESRTLPYEIEYQFEWKGEPKLDTLVVLDIDETILTTFVTNQNINHQIIEDKIIHKKEINDGYLYITFRPEFIEFINQEKHAKAADYIFYTRGSIPYAERIIEVLQDKELVKSSFEIKMIISTTSEYPKVPQVVVHEIKSKYPEFQIYKRMIILDDQHSKWYLEDLIKLNSFLVGWCTDNVKHFMIRTTGTDIFVPRVKAFNVWDRLRLYREDGSVRAIKNEHLDILPGKRLRESFLHLFDDVLKNLLFPYGSDAAKAMDGDDKDADAASAAGTSETGIPDTPEMHPDTPDSNAAGLPRLFDFS